MPSFISTNLLQSITQMKKLLLLTALLFVQAPAVADEYYSPGVCTQTVEKYYPPHYNAYGQYIPGGVYRNQYQVPCGGAVAYQAAPRYYNGVYCNPTKSILGGLLGGGIAASMSRGNGYAWSVPVGAAVGGAIVGCRRY